VSIQEVQEEADKQTLTGSRRNGQDIALPCWSCSVLLLFG